VGIDVGNAQADAASVGQIVHDELQAALAGRSLGERLALWRSVQSRWDDLSGSQQRIFGELAAAMWARKS
jgi:hypothetical protein